MNDIQNKLKEGISKVQNNISNNKVKLEDINNISNYNKIITDAQRKRDEILLEVGKIAYKKIRKDKLNDEELNEKCKNIIGFDYIIYENKKLIQEINDRNQCYSCSCGTEISKDSKFCVGCGKKVELKVEQIDYLDCNNCGMSIPDESNFCPCCGYEIEFDFSTFEV